MGAVYGRSLASKLNQEERYDEAVAEASRAIAQNEDDAIAWYDRACARSALGQHAETVADLEAALEHDRGADDLDVDMVDDAYFTALLAVARAVTPQAAGAARLGRYREILPRGSHHDDIAEWQARLRGEIAERLIVKERE